jgi:hypothetical protein
MNEKDFQKLVAMGKSEHVEFLSKNISPDLSVENSGGGTLFEFPSAD